MSRLRVQCFTLSIDGYGAGPSQSRDAPLGVGGETLHQWLYPTHAFKGMFDGQGGTTGVDDDYARRGTEHQVKGATSQAGHSMKTGMASSAEMGTSAPAART